MEGRTLKKGRFKTRMENAMRNITISPGSEPEDGEELGDDDAQE